MLKNADPGTELIPSPELCQTKKRMIGDAKRGSGWDISLTPLFCFYTFVLIFFLSFAYVIYRTSFMWEVIFLLIDNLPIIACFLIIIPLAIGAYTDYKDRIIPNFVPLSILVLGCFTATTWANKLLSLAGMIGILVLLRFSARKHRSGGGDVKLYCALSFALGLPSAALVMAFVILIRCLYVVLWKKEKRVAFPLCCYIAPAYVLYCVLLLIF